MISPSTIKAIIWDYDGTLVDTREKNLHVAKKIVRDISGRDSSEFAAFESLRTYDEANKRSINWRDLYMTEFDFSEKETEEAGRQWTEYQLRDDTPTPVYDGIDGVIRALMNVPHGIVSMNSKRNIEQVLEDNDLSDLFDMVVGYEEVDPKRQKPEPDGLLQCLQSLTGFAPGCVVYIGDHETDVKCVNNANRFLTETGKHSEIVSIGVFYGNHNDAADWKIKPDYEAGSPDRLLEIIRRFV